LLYFAAVLGPLALSLGGESAADKGNSGAKGTRTPNPLLAKWRTGPR
jgi:hypothetical protein